MLGRLVRFAAVVTALCAGQAVQSVAAKPSSVPSIDSAYFLRHHERILAAQAADDQASCDAAAKGNPLATYLSGLPETAGLKTCAASNLATLMAGLTTQCSITTLTGLLGSTNAGMTAFSELFSALTAGFNSSSTSASGTDLTSVLSSWTEDSTKNAAFCSTMNSTIGPCVQSILPIFLSLLENKAACCSELVEYYELIKLIVPTGKTPAQTLFDVVNGLHLTMCTKTGSDSYCGEPLLTYVAGVVEKTSATSLLSPLLFSAGLPLFALPDGDDACSALETTEIPSRVASTDGGAYAFADLSCCATGLSSLIESFDSIVTFLTGNSLAETLNLITARQDEDESSQFKAPYEAIKGCSFKKTCTKPSFNLPTDGKSAAKTGNPSKTVQPKGLKCTTTKLCNKDNVCSSVCEAGSVKIAPWVARAISYQRNLSYDQPLCFTELPGTHNSATTFANGYGNRDQLVNNMLDANNSDSYMRTSNQIVSLTDQLGMGARFLEIDSHYFAKSFRSGHCSRIQFSFLDDASAAIVRETGALLSAGSKEDATLVEWQASLMGCLPSLSGIRAEDERLHEETLNEIAEWVKANTNDLIILYTEIGSEIDTFRKTDDLLALYEKAFGDLSFTPADFKAQGGDWKDFKLSDLIAKGKRVIHISGSSNDLMFDMDKLCDGWSDIPNGKTGTAGAIWGQKTNSGKLIRAYQSQLHYATMSEDALGGSVVTGTDSEPATVTAATLPAFVKAGVNILAPDLLDGATMTAMVWSWASKEPSEGDTAVEISAKDGRWYGVKDKSSIQHVACVSTDDRLSWKIVSQGSSCPDGFAVGAPRLAVENTALVTALQATGADATAQLEVDLSKIPTISASDEAAFEDLSESGTGSGGDSAPEPSGATSIAMSWHVGTLMAVMCTTF
ncbi:hypothetical protein Poli38472_011983 [Pythium oligandrum]|uniref:PLC-like phosphodiesterase n=1 Tax=Pythium oligandrum TaxID=41045 RepID=A0A8K1CQL5_PYTOL|nr:hypothetical protein Poli38472_011983 [Pythium oligandrum]|eukprot:TMW66867.1 hypothetical protein Poli38472_011983 [Pythium oligandrum]